MKNRFVFNGEYISASHIFGGVNYTKCVNSTEELTIGTTACARIEFITDYNFGLGNMISLETQHEHDSWFRPIGLFNVTEVTKEKDKYRVVAYDNIIKFDRVIDAWYESLEWGSTGLSLSQLYTELCKYCDVQYDSGSFLNSSYKVPRKTFNYTNINGRTFLGYIAQCAGAYIHADALGLICISSFSTTNINLTGRMYKSSVLSDYWVPRIDKLSCVMEDGETKQSVGQGSNELILTYNPLFFIEDGEESALSSALTNIYNQISGYPTYRSGSIDLFGDYDVEAGDIVTVNGDTFIVMEKTMNNAGVTFNGFGNKDRDTTGTNVYEDVTNLNNQNALIRKDIDEISLRVSTANKVFRQPTVPRSDSTHTLAKNDLWFCTATIYGTDYEANKWYTYNPTTGEWDVATDGSVAELEIKTDTIEATVESVNVIYRQATIPQPTTDHPEIVNGDTWFCTGDVAGTDYKKDKWYIYSTALQAWEECTDTSKLDANGGSTTTNMCNWTLDSTSWNVFIGDDTDPDNLQFRINSNGAYIKGEVKASEGNIGGWIINGQTLTSYNGDDATVSRITLDPVNKQITVGNGSSINQMKLSPQNTDFFSSIVHMNTLVVGGYDPIALNPYKLRTDTPDGSVTFYAKPKVSSGSSAASITDNLQLTTKEYVDSKIAPSAYLKTASVSGNQLTLTKNDDSTVVYNPTTSGVSDVEVDGASVVSGGVATIPDASTSQKGVVQLDNTITANSTTHAATSHVTNALNSSITGLATTVANKVSDVTVNGASVLNASKVAVIPTASTSAYGATKLINSINSSSQVLAPTANAVRLAYNEAYDAMTEALNRQAQLVSGSNIKTINGNSILGSGDLSVGWPDLVSYSGTRQSASGNFTYKFYIPSAITGPAMVIAHLSVNVGATICLASMLSVYNPGDTSPSSGSNILTSLEIAPAEAGVYPITLVGFVPSGTTYITCVVTSGQITLPCNFRVVSFNPNN